MININIKVIPHARQRFATTGEWWVDKKGTLQIRVSDLGNIQYIMLHIFHEVGEAFASARNVCTHLDTLEQFDQQFERNRRKGRVSGWIDEVGLAEDCPYGPAHVFMTGLEMALATWLGVSWERYTNRCREVAGIDKPKKKK